MQIPEKSHVIQWNIQQKIKLMYGTKKYGDSRLGFIDTLVNGDYGSNQSNVLIPLFNKKRVKKIIR